MPRRNVLKAGTTEVFQIFVVDAKELGERYIKWDTAYYGKNDQVEYYPLPKGKLIVIYLLTSNELLKEAFSWQTIRRWTPGKEAYYRNLIGQEVEIIIEEGQVS